MSFRPLLAHKLTVMLQGASLAGHIQALVAAVHIFTSLHYEHLHPSFHNHRLCLVAVVLLHGLQMDLRLGLGRRLRGPVEDFACFFQLIVDRAIVVIHFPLITVSLLFCSTLGITRVDAPLLLWSVTIFLI